MYVPLLNRIAARLQSRLPQHVEVEDLVQDGYFGLARSLELFDPARGVRFLTFASIRIQGAMLDGIRQRDAGSRMIRGRQRALVDVIERLRQELGHEPTSAELAEFSGLADAELTALEIAAPKLESLHMVVADDSRQLERAAMLADPAAADPKERAAIVDDWRQALRGCSKQERILLLEYYCSDRTMREIGGDLNVSESRVSQMHSALIARLRQRPLVA